MDVLVQLHVTVVTLIKYKIHLLTMCVSKVGFSWIQETSGDDRFVAFEQSERSRNSCEAILEKLDS